MELAEVEEGVVDVLCVDEVGDEVVGDVFGGFGGAGAGFLIGGFVGGGEVRVVVGEGFQLGGGPAPVFEHLGGGFDEVADCVCACGNH